MEAHAKRWKALGGSEPHLLGEPVLVPSLAAMRTLMGDNGKFFGSTYITIGFFSWGYIGIMEKKTETTIL